MRRSIYFNSHPHEEDDAKAGEQICEICISTHILTKRMTTPYFMNTPPFLYFNSHPHEEDDITGTCNILWIGYFNSHPHEEDDLLGMILILIKEISTHILTKRMTVYQMHHADHQNHFNSHPHEEDDCFTKRNFTNGSISTHILTKRMTMYFAPVAFALIFQLTSSRRG